MFSPGEGGGGEGEVGHVYLTESPPPPQLAEKNNTERNVELNIFRNKNNFKEQCEVICYLSSLSEQN